MSDKGLVTILGCSALLVICLLTTAIIYATWNLVAVPLFGMPPVELWQAFLIGAALSLVGGMFKSHVSSS